MDKFLERLNECRNGMSVSVFARFLGLNQKTDYTFPHPPLASPPGAW